MKLIILEKNILKNQKAKAADSPIGHIDLLMQGVLEAKKFNTQKKKKKETVAFCTKTAIRLHTVQ